MPAHLAENMVAHMAHLATSTQEKIQALTLETRALRNALTKKELEIAQLKARQEEDHSSLLTMQSHGVLPVEFTMTEFEKHKRDNDEWFSEPFYSHPHGYKLCLKVDANGLYNTKGTHVSVGVRLMRGEFDDNLQFPFYGKISIQMINSLNSKEHCTDVIDFTEADDSITGRVTNQDRAPNGWGLNEFLPHSELGYDRAKNRQFLKGDCLHFRVTRVTNVDRITQLERQCLTIGSRVCIPPFDFIMRDFEQQKAENDSSYSPSFYSHPQGYKMCLEVLANGEGTGRGTHVSVSACLMRGEWDSYLKWPFRGDVTIQLLNQIEDKGHHKDTLNFTNDTPNDCAAQVTASERAESWGWDQFISQHKLNYRDNKNCQYLKYDSLHFRITKVKLCVVQFLLISSISQFAYCLLLLLYTCMSASVEI